MEKLESRSLPEQAADNIEQLIIENRWTPGEKLPNEMDMVEKLGVGRGTVVYAVTRFFHTLCVGADAICQLFTSIRQLRNRCCKSCQRWVSLCRLRECCIDLGQSLIQGVCAAAASPQPPTHIAAAVKSAAAVILYRFFLS